MDSSSTSTERANAQYQLAKIWLLRGRRDLATRSYRAALQLYPGLLSASLELSDLLERCGERAEALRVCAEASASSPKNSFLLRRIEKLRAMEVCESPLSDRAEAIPQLTPADTNSDHGTLLFYTDCSGTDGVEQCNHALMLDLRHAGYRIVCAEPFARNHLIASQSFQGVEHVWIDKGSIPPFDALIKQTTPNLVVFSSGSPFSDLPAKLAAAQSEIPFIIVVHCVAEDWVTEHVGLLPDLASAFLKASEVVAVSLQNLELLRKRHGLADDKGRVVTNGRPPVYFEEPCLLRRERVRSSLGLTKKNIACITVARMEVMKGYQYLVAALDLLRNSPAFEQLELIWVGTGTLETRLQALLCERGLAEKVKFLGRRDDVPEILEAGDLFVLPSQYEGMPLSLMEAMAKGLPTIASRVSGIPEAMGETGILLTDPRIDEPVFIRQLATALEHYASDDSERQFAGKQCRRRASRFSIKRMTREYREIIDRTIAAGTRERLHSREKGGPCLTLRRTN